MGIQLPALSQYDPTTKLVHLVPALRAIWFLEKTGLHIQKSC